MWIGIFLNYEIGDCEIFFCDVDDNYEELYVYNVLSDKLVYILGFVVDLNILYIKKYLGEYKVLYKFDLIICEEMLVFFDENYDVDGGFIYFFVINDVIGVYYL